MGEYSRRIIEDLWCRYTDKLLKYTEHDWYSLMSLFDKYKRYEGKHL